MSYSTKAVLEKTRHQIKSSSVCEEPVVKSVSHLCKREMTGSILIIGISSSNPAAATSEIEVSCLAAITTVAGSCQLESLCSR